MITSHTLVFSDFETEWYKRLASELKQNKEHLDNHSLKANKFWQNAIIAQTILERIDLSSGAAGIGFGVGQERLPALLAKHGAKIMATDQDFSTEKAKHWDKYELAQGTQSLNRLKICPPKKFVEQVDYMSVDMTKIPKKLAGQYDFAWSNCALGHLGSIEAGLAFIEDSLKCLKPGGWSVHTTEFNVLSNSSTSTGGDTVIFRPRDIRRLYRKLSKAGYVCVPLQYTIGASASDKRISMRPQFGNDYSKIQVNGHLATQGLIIIHKPKQLSRDPFRISRELSRHEVAYLQNLKAMASYRREPVIKQILKSQKAGIDKIRIQPAKKIISLKIKKGQKAEVFVPFINESTVPLFGLYSRLGDSKPIVLGTSSPKDRVSSFANESWPGDHDNRASSDLRLKKGKEYILADYIKAEEDFGFLVMLTSKNIPKGRYEEEFCIVQELVGWVEGSEVKLSIQVD